MNYKIGYRLLTVAFLNAKRQENNYQIMSAKNEASEVGDKHYLEQIDKFRADRANDKYVYPQLYHEPDDKEMFYSIVLADELGLHDIKDIIEIFGLDVDDLYFEKRLRKMPEIAAAIGSSIFASEDDLLFQKDVKEFYDKFRNDKTYYVGKDSHTNDIVNFNFKRFVLRDETKEDVDAYNKREKIFRESLRDVLVGTSDLDNCGA